MNNLNCLVEAGVSKINIINEHKTISRNDAAVPRSHSARDKASDDDHGLVLAHRILTDNKMISNFSNVYITLRRDKTYQPALPEGMIGMQVISELINKWIVKTIFRHSQKGDVFWRLEKVHQDDFCFLNSVQKDVWIFLETVFGICIYLIIKDGEAEATIALHQLDEQYFLRPHSLQNQTIWGHHLWTPINSFL